MVIDVACEKAIDGGQRSSRAEDGVRPGAEPDLFSYDHGLHVTGAGLWLDAHAPKPLCVVSHAHSDHVRRHRAMICTAPTADLIRERYGAAAAMRVVPFGDALGLGAARLTLFPAGHVLGSAQALVETTAGRLLYSGDIRLRPGAAAEVAEAPRADVLITETTFGRPQYVFPPEDDILAAILAFCEEGFRVGETPVLFAYSLGKAQEAIMLLSRAGLNVAAHPSVERLNVIYRRHGVALPQCLAWDAPLPARTAIVCPPQARKSAVLAALRRRTAMLTGWAMDAGAKFRFQCDAAFPLSDHCGYDDLLRYVELSGARTVYTLHGFARAFAEDLQRRGVEAYPLGLPMQLPLPGLV